MLAFLSNRATAAHLAIAAVAPLVLCKYFSAGAVAVTLLWISLVAAIWAFAAPGRDEGEHSYEALRRFVRHSLADPFVWVLLLLLGYSVVVALNVGVALVYDAEAELWRLARPAVSSLPGSVAGCGGRYFAAAVVALAVYPAAAYAVDRRQSADFAFLSAMILMADAAFAHVSGVGIGGDRAAAYGLWSLVAASAVFSAERSGERVREMLATIALSGCLAALLFTGRPAVICIFAAALAASVVVFVASSFSDLRIRGSVRALTLTAVSCAAAVAVIRWRCGYWGLEVPVWSSASDGVLTRLALKAWESVPWSGVGVGGFPAAARLCAAPADWTVLGVFPDYYGCGWRTLLAERGMVGVLAVAVSLGAMAYAWFRRARSRGGELFAAAMPLFPIAAAAVGVCMVFDGSALEADSLVAFASLAALSVNGGV